MTDNELMQLVEETIGNKDPYWTEGTFNVVKKIIELPEGAEFSISRLYDGGNKDSSKYMHEIFNSVKQTCKKLGIEFVRPGQSDGPAIIGLPYNINYTKKTI